MKKETLVLSNLNCPTCAAELQRAVARLNGVKRAEVAFGSGTLELEYDEGVVKAGDIERTVRSFGAAVAGRI